MNLPVSKISEHEETYSTSLFSMLLPLGSDSIAKQDEIYNVQKEVIRERAEKESCIIVGRCADYILRNHANAISVYLYASKEECLRHEMEYMGYTQGQAMKEIKRMELQK